MANMGDFKWNSNIRAKDGSPGSVGAGEAICCQKCRNYYVTWDPRFPYGCRLFHVKSMQAPSVIVYQSTGKQCEWFEQKG